MRFIVTFFYNSEQKVFLFKEYEKAYNFMQKCRKRKSEITDLKLKIIKY